MSTDINDTLTERGSRYGSFSSKAGIIQAVKSCLRSSPSWDSLPDHMKESLEMIVHKMARIITGDPFHKDSWHDIAGYAKLVEEILEGNDP